MSQHETFLARAVSLAQDNAGQGGRPFGAVLVMDGKVVSEGVNEIMKTGDPTAHAEMLAVRRAAEQLGAPHLEGAVVYASGQPCPMCLSAMILAGVSEIRYAFSNEDGEPYGLSSARIYDALSNTGRLPIPFVHTPLQGVPAKDIYASWRERRET